MARLTTLAVTLFALLAGVRAGAEQERVDGMGRTRGWVVASDSGELEFVDCYGRRAPLGTSRVEPSTQRCPTSPTPVEITGVIRSVDSERRIVRAEDDAGRVRAFHIGVDVLRLEDLKPGERIQATGPIEGQITGLTRR